MISHFVVKRVKKTKIPDKALILYRRENRFVISVDYSNLDWVEVISILGANRISKIEFSIPLRHDFVIDVLLNRVDFVFVEGVRGGFVKYSRKSYPKAAIAQPKTVSKIFNPIEVVSPFKGVMKWDVLGYKGGMRRGKFMDLAFVSTYGPLSTRLPVILLRGDFLDGNRIYVSYNMLAQQVDAVWDHGSIEGWRLRLKFEDLYRRWNLPIFENSSPQFDFYKRNIKALWLEKKLSSYFGSVIVIDRDHTSYPEGFYFGSDSKKINFLSKVYGDFGGYEVVIIMDTKTTRFKREVVKLSMNCGIVDEVSNCLGIIDPLSIVR